MSSAPDQRFFADRDVPVCSLQAKEAWDALTKAEQLYAHWMSKASWAGREIIQTQWTPHSVRLHQLLVTIFSHKDGKAVDYEQLKHDSGVADKDWSDLLAYVTQVFSNLTNYRTFGDTKFVPRADKQAFEKLVKASPRGKEASSLWKELAAEIYSTTPAASLHIGKPADGHVTGYYEGETVTDADVANVLAVCDREGLSSLNTRLRKNGANDFTLLISSANTAAPPNQKTTIESESPKLTLQLQYGDFSEALGRANVALKEASKHVEGNETRRKMLEGYVECFETGSIEAHKRGSGHWVKDKGPVVETYIGHIESYVDPWQARAEWEGFVAVTDKKLSERFGQLVTQAPGLIATLPWGKAFEVESFQSPEYLGLIILSFCTGGIPAGINIPNYHDVREKDGNKNVSLLNILNAKAANEEIKFALEADRKLLEQWQGKTFEVQVACHELLGHGTGRIFTESADGKFNFDKSTINPLTGKPIASWYKPGETPNGKIGSVYGAFEEMRAETVGMFLCGNKDILKIFGYTSEEETALVPYINYLIMARAGLRALEFYEPSTGKHGQAHMQARIGITLWLIRDKIVSLHIDRNDAGVITNAYITVDRAALADGRAGESMGRLLIELQVRRSVGDAEGATSFIKKLTTPPEEWKGELRDYVLANRSPRKVFVQPNTYVRDDGTVELREYPATCEGVITSFVERDQ